MYRLLTPIFSCRLVLGHPVTAENVDSSLMLTMMVAAADDVDLPISPSVVVSRRWPWISSTTMTLAAGSYCRQEDPQPTLTETSSLPECC